MENCDKCVNSEDGSCTCNLTWDQVEIQKLKSENEKLREHISVIESELDDDFSNSVNTPSVWNYRIIISKDGESDTRMSIHEVYYDENGMPVGMAESPAIMIAGSFVELVEVYEKFKEAFSKPVILEDIFHTKINHVYF